MSLVCFFFNLKKKCTFVICFFRFSDAPIVSIDLATGYVLDTLREGDDLKLVCDVESNPPPTRIIWYHKVRGFLPLLHIYFDLLRVKWSDYRFIRLIRI